MKVKLLSSLMLGATALSATALEFESIEGLQVHGFASQGYLYSTKMNYLADTTDGSGDFRELGLNAMYQISDDLRIGGQLFSRRLGPLGQDDVRVDWLYLDYRLNDMIGFRLGRVKVPLGLHNEYQDYDSLRSSVFLPQSVYDSFLRDTRISYDGIGAYGHLALGDSNSLDYHFYYGTTELENDGSYGLYFDDSFNDSYPNAAVKLWTDIDDFDVHNQWGGQIMWSTPVDGLRLGTSFRAFDWSGEAHPTAGFSFVGDRIRFEQNQSHIWIHSAEYRYEDWLFQAEYLSSRGDIDTNIPIPGLNVFAVDQEGWYGLVSKRLNDWCTLGAYYSVFYREQSDRKGENDLTGKTNWQKDFCVNVKFDLTDNLLLKLEAHQMDGNALTTDNVLANDRPYAKDWQFYAAKITYYF